MSALPFKPWGKDLALLMATTPGAEKLAEDAVAQFERDREWLTTMRDDQLPAHAREYVWEVLELADDVEPTPEQLRVWALAYAEARDE